MDHLRKAPQGRQHHGVGSEVPHGPLGEMNRAIDLASQSSFLFILALHPKSLIIGSIGYAFAELSTSTSILHHLFVQILQIDCQGRRKGQRTDSVIPRVEQTQRNTNSSPIQFLRLAQFAIKLGLRRTIPRSLDLYDCGRYNQLRCTIINWVVIAILR